MIFMCYWETFKRQAIEDYLKASEEYAFATEYDSKDEVAKVEIVLNERGRVLEKICGIDEHETVRQMLNVENEKVSTDR